MTSHERNLLNLHKRRDFRNQLAHKKTRQGRFEESMWHLDHPAPGAQRILQASDKGAGAEKVYGSIECKPLWLKLYEKAYRKLTPTGKKVVKALERDWRSRHAAKIAGVSQPTIDKWKTNLKIHFAPCFRAWERDFGHR